MEHFRPGFWLSVERSFEWGGQVHVYPIFKSLHVAVGSQSFNDGSRHSFTNSSQTLPEIFHFENDQLLIRKCHILGKDCQVPKYLT